MSKHKIVDIKLSAITPDPAQPRRNFDPSKLKRLADSIKKNGVMNPVRIQEVSKGKYLLVDGERRFRASKIAKQSTIPAYVAKITSGDERLIQQFNLQVLHEDWSAPEKAVALAKLAKNMKLSMKATAELVGIPERSAAEFIAFADLVDPNTFIKSDIGIKFAAKIKGLVAIARRMTRKFLQKDFTKEDQKLLENALVDKIVRGQIETVADFGHIADVFRHEPKKIKEFCKRGTSVVEFIESGDAHKERKLREMRNILYSVQKKLAEVRQISDWKAIDEVCGHNVQSSMISTFRKLGETLGMDKPPKKKINRK